ncbi:MAG TPA: heme NO-binding domain-containing protein [Polyangiaceae bacterium]|nr:heme NO-binding domain-containing protein [Polyangiaceae bacterium]
MYGLINAALKQFVLEAHGAEVWDRIAASVAPGIAQFDKMSPYPDELTFRIVASASELTAIDADVLLGDFGDFWVSYTSEQGYGPMFDVAGDSLRDFLLSLDTLHARVGRSFPKLRPPSFRFDTIDPSTMRMHYVSSRSGLCPMVFGLLRGLGRRFATEITVREDVCARRGAAHCEFVVGLGPRKE